MSAPICYGCVYRQNVPGDAHSACGNPLVQRPDTAALCAAAVMQFGGFTTDHLTVRFNAHGVRNGWALFPFNFDPAWLEVCTGVSTASPAERSDLTRDDQKTSSEPLPFDPDTTPQECA